MRPRPWARLEGVDTGASCNVAIGVTAPCAMPTGGLPDWGDHLRDGIRPPSGLRVAAVGAANEAYDGDLLADILEYRSMRAQTLRGETLDRACRSRFDAIEAKLRSRTDSTAAGGREARVYHRFDCSFEGRVVVGGIETRGRVENASAGGVKIQMPAVVQPGTPVDFVVGDADDAVVLPSRVAWTRDGAAGLMFAGAPRCR